MKIVRLVFFAVFCLILLQNVSARHRRERRISDQRLAELEALLAMSKMKGKMVTVPLAFGKLDPMKIGRRRRSIPSETAFIGRLFALSQSSNEDDSEPSGEYIEKFLELE